MNYVYFGFRLVNKQWGYARTAADYPKGLVTLPVSFAKSTCTILGGAPDCENLDFNYIVRLYNLTSIQYIRNMEIYGAHYFVIGK